MFSSYFKVVILINIEGSIFIINIMSLERNLGSMKTMLWLHYVEIAIKNNMKSLYQCIGHS